MSALIPIAKALGAVLVVGAGGVTGFSLASRMEWRLRELERLEAALLCLRGEISYSLTPLPQALQRAGERAGGAIGTLFCRFGASTGLSQRRTAAEALEEILATSGVGAGAGIDASVREILTELSAYLGTSGHNEQCRFIDMSLDKAKRLRQEFEDECRKRVKLYRYLGLLGGACVAVILL